MTAYDAYKTHTLEVNAGSCGRTTYLKLDGIELRGVDRFEYVATADSLTRVTITIFADEVIINDELHPESIEVLRKFMLPDGVLTLRSTEPASRWARIVDRMLKFWNLLIHRKGKLNG
jgi:hypothetical protein